MVRVEDITLNADMTANVALFADTKSEVATAEIKGLPNGYSIAAGSIVRTAAFEVGTLKSDGTWSWA